MVIGILVLVGGVVVGGGWWAYKHFGTKSPEDQIRTVVQREMGDLNAQNFNYNTDFQCKKYAGQNVTPKEQKEARKIMAKAGTVSATVANIHVTGDNATADVTMTFQKLPGKPYNDNWTFIKEDKKWKECNPPSTDDSDQGDDDSGG